MEEYKIDKESKRNKEFFEKELIELYSIAKNNKDVTSAIRVLEILKEWFVERQ